MSGPEHNEDRNYETEDRPNYYQLPSIGVVVSFDGYEFMFTPTQSKFDVLTTPMQREILRAMLLSAADLVEKYE